MLRGRDGDGRGTEALTTCVTADPVSLMGGRVRRFRRAHSLPETPGTHFPEEMPLAAIEVRDLVKTYVLSETPPRRSSPRAESCGGQGGVPVGPRPVGFRQEHPDAHSRLPRPADPPANTGSWAVTWPRLGNDERARNPQRGDRLRLPELPPARPGERPRETWSCPCSTARSVPAREERRQNAAEALDAVGLSDRATHAPSQLSGGHSSSGSPSPARARQPAAAPAGGRTHREPRHPDRTRNPGHVSPRLNSERGLTVVMITHDRQVAQVRLPERRTSGRTDPDGRKDRDQRSDPRCLSDSPWTATRSSAWCAKCRPSGAPRSRPPSRVFAAIRSGPL